MSEENFTKNLQAVLKPVFGDDNVKYKEMLLYKLFINQNGVVLPENPLIPAKQNYAFETDLLIMENELPAVVIEVKYKKFTTHDILTYSTKALRHKEIYPFIRYGFLLGGADKITNKFFTHNVGFDFACAMPEITESFQSEFIKLIKSQVKASQALKKVLREKNTARLFNSRLDIKHV